jgi:hypothetical protein
VSPSALDGYREVASTLTPPAVSQYLATQNWELETRQAEVREIWRLPDEGGHGVRGRIMLPLATDYADFPQRFNEALLALGRIHDWDATQLQEKILSTRADLFFVRLNQAMSDGTIPFRQAEKTVDAIFKLLKSAATTAADPHHSHLGRRPTAVSDFLEEDVRLGHTKRGSFVFTVITRLGDPPSDHQPSGPPVTQLFPRRVMTTLAQGLETTQKLTHQWDQHVLDSPGTFGVSAGLVESLEEMAEPEGLLSLDLSFEWAAAEVPPEVDAGVVVMDRGVMTALPRVRERLVRQEEPARRETVVGMVRSLTREDAGPNDDGAGTVVVVADVRGKTRSIHMALSGRDHEWAILAYRQRLPFTVTGDLCFERRAWRLTGDVHVDSSFLRHQAGS